MVEPEVAYGQLDDIMELAEGLISFIVQRCLERRRVDLQTIGRDITKLERITPPFPRITYDQAVKSLQEGHAKGALESKFEWGGDLGSPEEAFKWYLDLRKYGSVPHGGFGMGIERAVAWICGLEHVRETIPFPRMLHRLYP